MQAEIDEYIRSDTGRTYVSDWLLVDQGTIQAFADATRDWNFLHVDPEVAGRTEYGTTIAHGFLVLSLLAPLRNGLDRARFPHLRVGVNYGVEGLRWVSATPSGARVRGHFTVASIEPDGPGRYRETLDVTVEIEGAPRPAMVGRWLTMYMT